MMNNRNRQPFMIEVLPTVLFFIILHHQRLRETDTEMFRKHILRVLLCNFKRRWFYKNLRCNKPKHLFKNLFKFKDYLALVNLVEAYSKNLKLYKLPEY